MNRDLWTFLGFVVVGALVLLLVNARTPPTAGPPVTEPPVLRVHAVPSEREDQIRDALAQSLSMGEYQVPLGRVSTAGPGALVVLAPEAVQADVKTAIAALGGDAPPAGASDSVMLDLWSIVAVPGEGADDSALAPLATTLDGARPALGRVRFEQGDTLSVTALADNDSFDARTPGGFIVNGFLRRAEAGVTARLSVSNPALSTTLQLRFGEPLVVARMPDGDGRTRVLVVRARLADARG